MARREARAAMRHGERDVRKVKGADTRTSIQFTEAQTAELRRIDEEAREPRTRVVATSLRLDDLTRLRDEAAEAHRQAVQAYRVATQNVEKRVKDIAAEHGLDLSRPTAGKWAFSFETGRFTKQP